MRIKQITIPLQSVLPGQHFAYLGQKYVRAQKDQVGGHPSQELVRQREPGSLVLAYSLVYRKDDKVTRTPVAIAVEIDSAVTMVWVRGDVQ